MSVHKNMIINFLVPIFLLIVATTILGTICLKHISYKNRDILESTSNNNVIASGIVMNNGGNIDRFLTDKEILACYYMKASACSNQLKCCEDQVRILIFKVKSAINLVTSFIFWFFLGQSRWQLPKIKDRLVRLEIWFGSAFTCRHIRLLVNIEQQLWLYKFQECHKVNVKKKLLFLCWIF